MKQFYIGKTYIRGRKMSGRAIKRTNRRYIKFRSTDPTTWKLGGGINRRFQAHKEKLHGLFVLAAFSKKCLPDTYTKKLREAYKDCKIKLKDYVKDDESRRTTVKYKTVHKKVRRSYKRYEVSYKLESYTLAVKSRLISHFMFTEPDRRLANNSTHSGKSDKEGSYAYAIYVAFTMKGCNCECW